MAALTTATLEERERRALERAVIVLEQLLDADLLAVWLYGSRARGEVVPPDSDIDLVAITREPMDWRARDAAKDRVREAVKTAGGDPWSLSLQLLDREWVAESRANQSFFMQELDRDRIVLAGPEGGEIAGLPPFDGYEKSARGIGGMSTRSSFQLERAFDRLRAAERLLVEGEDRSAVASDAYYAMLVAASAALSEAERPARTHAGSWHNFRELYVARGRFDPELAALGSRYQELREVRDFVPSEEEAENAARDARRFVEAVSRMLGVEPF